MKDGDVIRVRGVRCYSSDPRNWFDFAPDRERARDLKRVFVCLVLGTELFELVKKGKKIGAELNVTKALNRLGWWREDQIMAIYPKQGLKIVEKLQEKQPTIEGGDRVEP